MVPASVYDYCCEDPSLIEGYDRALSDDSQMYICHHRNGILLGMSWKELDDAGLYFNRPASELLLLTRAEHSKLHGDNMSDEVKDKISNTVSEYNSNCLWWNNGVEEVFRPECPEGFEPGRLPMSDDVKTKISKSCKGLFTGENNPAFGRHWWVKGDEQRYEKECPGQGWVRGKLKQNPSTQLNE